MRSHLITFIAFKIKFKLKTLLCDPMDYTVLGILQARILEWVAIPFFRDLPNPAIEPRSPAVQADSFPSEPPGKPVLYVALYISEKAMAPHSSTLAWRIPMDRGAWRATVHGVAKSWT